MATQVKTGLIANDAITDAKIANVALTGVTASSGDSSTSLATTAFVATEINSLIDSAPGALNTLNELAAAMGDDANFSTTVTNSIATKLPLAGGSLTGDLTLTSGTSGKPHLNLINTNADSSAPVLNFKKDSASPADNDEVGRIYMWGDDDAGNATEAFLAIGKMTDVSNGSEDSSLDLYTLAAGAQTATLTLKEGNVGIGETNPDAKLHIMTASNGASTVGTASDELILENSTDCGLTIRSGSTSTGVISFADADDHNVGQVYYDHSTNDMTFRTNDSIAMTLDDGGKLGIGNDAPNRQLSLKHASQAEIGFKTGSVSNGALIYYNDTENKLLLRAQETSDHIEFQTGGITERMRITAGGDVSIGSNHAGFSGWRVLNIRGATANDGALINFENSAGTRSATFANQSIGMRYQTHIAGGYHRFETEGTPNGYPLYIANDGKVGIGTGTPTMPLSVQAASNAYAISMHGRSDGYSELYGASNDGSTKYSFLQSHSSQTKLYTLVNTPLLFGTNSTERMRITNTGNVGIGNQSPNAKLYVEGPQNDTYGQLYIKGGSAANQDPQIAMGSNQNGRGFYIDDSAVNRFKIYTGHGKGASSGAYEFVLDNSGTIESKRTYANTTGAYSANVYVHTDGSFNRATSSRRYKKDIVDADKGLDEILQLKPRNYKPENNRIDSSEVNAEVNDPHLDAAERTFAGLIAEEVHDLGLTEYVDYEEDGTTPSGLYYGNMVALLVKGIQEQQTIINDLKARIETLEG